MRLNLRDGVVLVFDTSLAVKYSTLLRDLHDPQDDNVTLDLEGSVVTTIHGCWCRHAWSGQYAGTVYALERDALCKVVDASRFLGAKVPFDAAMHALVDVVMNQQLIYTMPPTPARPMPMVELLYAVRCGVRDPAVYQTLLDNGAHPNFEDLGFTALEYAMFYDYTELFELLADVTSHDVGVYTTDANMKIVKKRQLERKMQRANIPSHLRDLVVAHVVEGREGMTVE